MNLPNTFLQKMTDLLGEEADALFEALEAPRHLGLRRNPLKISAQQFTAAVPFPLEAVPWAAEGYFYREENRPGKHPYHEAGLYYIQEPSAMAVGEALDPQPGERILDLCAAPGGKTTHIGGRMEGHGLLVSNEIHPGRAKILSQNVERMGLTNCVVCNESPDRLAPRFPAFFDRVLVDAPCSGEGMFRKEEAAREQWSSENVSLCADRQDEILDQAAAMLRPGGRLVYSTCTFSPEEDEGSIHRFLLRHPNFSVLPLPQRQGFAPGNPAWVEGGEPALAHTLRLWPHRMRGEGHFLAALVKGDGIPQAFDAPCASAKGAAPEEYLRFGEAYLRKIPLGNFLLFGSQLYLLPEGLDTLNGLKVLRPGWHLGEIKKGRFEPSHALALGMKPEQARTTVPCSAEAALAYLRGQTLDLPGEKGWCVVTMDGFPLGWGKRSGTQVKNHFPKGLRWNG